jgi:hypothetical protein
MEQNLGPHMEQKWAVLAGSWGRVASWNSLAVTGSSDRLNWSCLSTTRNDSVTNHINLYSKHDGGRHAWRTRGLKLMA